MKNMKARTRRISGKRSFSFSVLLNSTGVLSFNIVNMTLLLATSIVLARGLGPDGFGAYSYAIGLAQLLHVFCNLGLPTLLVRQIPYYISRQETGHAKGLLKWANSVTGILSIVVAVLYVIVITAISHRLDRTLLFPLLIGILQVPILIQAEMFTSALRGLKYILASQIPLLLVRPGLFFLLILLFSAYYKGFSASHAVFLQVMAGLVAGLWSLFILLRRIPEDVLAATAVTDTAWWFKVSRSFFIIFALQAVLRQIPSILLGPLYNIESVGFFQVAQRGANLLSLCLMAVNVTLAPEISSFWAKQDMIRLQRSISKSMRVVILLTLPATVILILGRSFFIALVFGEAYLPASLPMAILALGQLIGVAAGPVALLLNMTNQESIVAKTVVVVVVTNLLLSILLIPPFGAIGAASAWFISFSGQNIALAILAWRRLGVNPSALGAFTSKS